MLETNEEISQKLKQAICDYYMGYVKQKFKYLLANGKENEIASQIMQFLDIQIDTRNFNINKEDMIRILNSVLIEDSASSDFDTFHILHCFPTVADVHIEDGHAAYLVEKSETPFSGIEEKTCYLYMSPEYYNNNIRKY